MNQNKGGALSPRQPDSRLTQAAAGTSTFPEPHPTEMTNVQTEQGKLGQRLIANTLFNFAGQAYVLVLGLAVVPYIVHRLGAGLYAVVVLVQALAGFAGLLNLGMGRALTKYVSELYWQGNIDRICALFQTALASCLFGGMAGCLVLIGPRRVIASALFHGEADAQAVAYFALYVTGFGLLLSLLTEALSALPIALQRFDVYNRMNILTATVRNLGSVAVLALGFSVKAVLLVNLLSGFVAVVGYVHFGRKLIPGLNLAPKFAWTGLKRLVSFSIPVLVCGVSALVVHRLDRLMVAYFLPIGAVAFFVVPYSLAEKVSLGVGNINSVIFPSSSELAAMQEQEKLRELYLRATKMVTLAALPVTMILLSDAGLILHFWVGPDFELRGSVTLQLLAVGCLINVLGSVAFVVSQGIGRPWVAANLSLAVLTISFLLNLLSIPHYGIVGAAISFLISQAFAVPILVGMVNRALAVSWRRLITSALLRPFACALIALEVLLGSRPYVDSLLKLILWSALALSAYALSAYVIAIDHRERVGICGEVLHIFLGKRRTGWDFGGQAPRG